MSVEITKQKTRKRSGSDKKKKYILCHDWIRRHRIKSQHSSIYKQQIDKTYSRQKIRVHWKNTRQIFLFTE